MSLPCELPNYIRDSFGDCIEATQAVTWLQFAIGCLLMCLISGLSSLAGLGGGGPNIVVMILCFNMLPKHASIAVFASILGSSFGNMVNQMQTAFNNQPMIRYQYAFVTLPLMFIGSLIGVLLNKWLPSVVIVTIIIGVATYSFPKIYQRYCQTHRRETEQLLMHRENQRNSDLIKETRINPFDDEINKKIFQQIGMLVVFYVCLALMRGSERFPSVIGVTGCSLGYWGLEVAIFVMAFWFYKYNKQSLDEWTAPTITLGEELFERIDYLQENKSELIQKGICAGIFSGFGLGGGIFLVPLYRQLKLNPLQATATCTFTIFITASINCIQAILMGVLTIKQFLFYFGVCAFGSYFLSVLISNILRKANRLSCVEILLLLLLMAANINLPISLWLKYVESGHNLHVIFGFGNLC